MSYSDFRKSLLKVTEKRNHKIKNSIGVYDAYKHIRKNKWYGLPPITENQFYTIIRGINKSLVDNLLEGYSIKLPHRMGKIELRKCSTTIKLTETGVENNLPVNWNRTLKLWYEDEESFNNRTLIKEESKEIFRIIYNKHRACYNNKVFYDFKFNRELKIKLKDKIKNGELDAFKLW